MSWTEKVATLMKRPGEDVVPKDEVPWWMKYAGRGLGTVGGGIAIFLGVWNMISIVFGDVSCLLSGIWQMLAGFSAIVIEAPCCCLFLDFVQTFSDWVDKRPYWNRAAYYMGVAIPAVLFCPGMSSIFGSGLIFGTGVLYGMMALGKKASPEEMRANAAQQAPGGLPAAAGGSIFNTSSKTNLVDNASPMGFTGNATLPPV